MSELREYIKSKKQSKLFLVLHSSNWKEEQEGIRRKVIELNRMHPEAGLTMRFESIDYEGKIKFPVIYSSTGFFSPFNLENRKHFSNNLPSQSEARKYDATAMVENNPLAELNDYVSQNGLVRISNDRYAYSHATHNPSIKLNKSREGLSLYDFATQETLAFFPYRSYKTPTTSKTYTPEETKDYLKQKNNNAVLSKQKLFDDQWYADIEKAEDSYYRVMATFQGLLLADFKRFPAGSYPQRKHLLEEASFFTNASSDTLYIPAYNFDAGNLMTTYQTIDKDGNKRFLSGGIKKGSYYSDRLLPTDAKGLSRKNVVITEGIATYSSFKRLFSAAIDHLVNTGVISQREAFYVRENTYIVSAFDVGNLETLTRQVIHRNFDVKNVFVASDNDFQKVENVGLKTAQKLETEYKGTVVSLLPVLAKYKERGYTGSLSDYNDLEELVYKGVIKHEELPDLYREQLKPFLTRALSNYQENYHFQEKSIA